MTIKHNIKLTLSICLSMIFFTWMSTSFLTPIYNLKLLILFNFKNIFASFLYHRRGSSMFEDNSFSFFFLDCRRMKFECVFLLAIGLYIQEVAGIHSNFSKFLNFFMIYCNNCNISYDEIVYIHNVFLSYSIIQNSDWKKLNWRRVVSQLQIKRNGWYFLKIGYSNELTVHILLWLGLSVML